MVKMNNLYNDILGYYIPSFFTISMEQCTLSDIIERDKRALNVFFHEYLHFYQDICTVYGLSNIILNIDTIKTCVLSLQDKDEVSFPISITVDEIMGINADLNSLYYGDDEFNLDSGWEIIDVIEEPNGIISGYEYIPEIKIKYKQGSSEPKYLRFGSLCIMESMAAELDRHVFNDLSCPEFPYNVGRKVIKYYLPELSMSADEMSLFILAICDLSLNSFHPAEHFVKIIKYIISSRDYDIGRLYNHFDNLTIIWNDKSYKNIEMVNKLGKIARSNFSDVINRQTHGMLIDWLDDLLENARVLREKINLIHELSGLINYDQRTAKLRKIMNYLGTPIIIDKDGYLALGNVMYDVGSFASYVLGMKTVLKLFGGIKGDTSCAMTKNCRVSLSAFYNDNICNNTPWLMAQSEMLCPFAQVWATWGLRNLKIR
jgi:hypothetical protein